MIRKGLWSPEEDDKLRWCISMYVNGSWNDIARKAGLQRCGRSCRQRWLNHLRPGLKKGKFSNEELRQVLNLHSKLGNRWSQIAGHLEGRTDNEVKNLWNTVIKRRLILARISACKSGDCPTHLDPIKRQPPLETSDIVNAANDDLVSIKRDAISLISLGDAQNSPSHTQSVSSSHSSSSCACCNLMENPNPSPEVGFSSTLRAGQCCNLMENPNPRADLQDLSSTLRDGQCCTNLMENPNPSSDVQDFTSTTLIRDGQCCTNLMDYPNPGSDVDFSSTLRDGQCLIEELMLNSEFTTMIEGRNSLYGHEAHSSTAPACMMKTISQPNMMEEELDYASTPVPGLSPDVYKINQPIVRYDQPLIPPPPNLHQDWDSAAKLLELKSADIKETLDGDSMDGGQLSSCFIPNQHMTIYGHSLPSPSDAYMSNSFITDNIFLHSIDGHHHDLTAILPHHLPHYQNDYSMHGILANSGVEWHLPMASLVPHMPCEPSIILN